MALHCWDEHVLARPANILLWAIGYMQAFLPPAELGVFKKVTTLYDHNRRKAKALKAQHIRPMRNASAWRASIDASVRQLQQQCIQCFGASR